MSWYGAELDRLTPTVQDAVLAVQRPWETPVRCSGEGCTGVATIHGFGLEAVRSRTNLYCHGWRQRPGTRQSYCPTCAVAQGLA